MATISGSSGGVLSGVSVSGVAAAGQVPVASSASVGAWAYPPAHEIGYAQITSFTNITDTSEATATSLISPGALTFDGGAVIVTFSGLLICDSLAASDQCIVTLFEGSTQITRLCAARTTVTTSPLLASVVGMYRFTPTAASHTYKVCAFVPSTNGTPQIGAGAGGTAAYPPAFVRFTKV